MFKNEIPSGIHYSGCAKKVYYTLKQYINKILIINLVSWILVPIAPRTLKDLS